MIKQIIISGLVLLALDAAYISLILKEYNKQILDIQGSPMTVKLLGGIICYVLLIFGVNYFIIRHKKSPGEAFLLGLLIYGVFDSTNYALISKWNGGLAIVDSLWGGVLFALTTWLIYSLPTNWTQIRTV